MVKQYGGGSVGQSIRYVDTAAPERTANAGSDLLIQRGLVVRPAIGGGTRKRKGGFYPSVMAGVVDNGMMALPLAGFAARKLMSRKARKTRKGGGKKAERWQADREEARAKLLQYGKPSAQNVQKYAIARRRGDNVANQFLEEYMKRKQEHHEAEQAKKAAKKKARNEAKAVRNAQKAANKTAKLAKKAANKTARNALKAAVKAEKAAAKELAKAQKAAAKEAAKAAKEAAKATKKNKPVKEKKTKKAKNNVAVPAPAPAPAKKGTHVFFNNEGQEVAGTQARNKALNSLAKKIAEPETTTSSSTAKKEKKAKNATTRKEPSNASKKYFEELRKARQYLGTIGAPTGMNMSKYASMKMKGKNTSEWEENFKTRRPLSMLATMKVRKPKKAANATVKAPTPKAPTPKALTAVQEEEENEMQGYSENFESEPESNKNKNEN